MAENDKVKSMMWKSWPENTSHQFSADNHPWFSDYDTKNMGFSVKKSIRLFHPLLLVSTSLASISSVVLATAAFV